MKRIAIAGLSVALLACAGAIPSQAQDSRPLGPLLPVFGPPGGKPLGPLLPVFGPPDGKPLGPVLPVFGSPGGKPLGPVLPAFAGSATPNIGSLIFEAGGLNVGNSDYSASCSGACPARPAQNATPDASFAGVDLRLNLAALLSFLNQPVRFTDSFVMTGPFMGFRVRRYFNYRGHEIGYDFHPTAGIDTFLAYSAAWSYKTYIGMQFMLLNPFGSSLALAGLGIAPYVGVNFERGKVRLMADETGGGGTVNTFEKVATRSGTAYGVDFDFYFRNLPFFIGLGLQWDVMPEATITARSAINNLDYSARIADRTNFTAAARLGIPLASDIRLKRDIAAVGRHADGIGLYRYRYLWSDVEYVGVMAQEVERVMPEAVVRGADGFLRVNYDRIGARMMTWNEWSGSDEASVTR